MFESGLLVGGFAGFSFVRNWCAFFNELLSHSCWFLTRLHSCLVLVMGRHAWAVDFVEHSPGSAHDLPNPPGYAEITSMVCAPLRIMFDAECSTYFPMLTYRPSG